MNRPSLAALALAASLALAGCASGGGEPAAATPTASATPPAATTAPGVEAVFTVTGGARSAGPERVEVAAGEPVRLVVTSDTAEEVHVHGYDLTLPLEPGEEAVLEFTADLPGVYEVELHGSGGLLAQLRVS